VDEGSILVEIQKSQDIVEARSVARKIADSLDFDAVNQTRIATAVSEIARNALTHGHGGKMTITILKNRGIEITVIDEGPGIPDVDEVMIDGRSSKGTWGLGLGGAKRLMDEFNVESKPGEGTQVTMRKYQHSSAW